MSLADLEALNAAQRQAVTAGRGPLLVLAGAGTGKTRVIIARIAYLARGGTEPHRIAAITFTNKAAREMRERLAPWRFSGEHAPWISTFHALGHHILRVEHRALGYRSGFPILDEADARGVLVEILRELGGVRVAETRLEEVRRAISRSKARFETAEEALAAAGGDAEYFAARAYVKYRERLAGMNAVDFDDLIMLPVRLIEGSGKNGALVEDWRRRFAHVLVDEYQDSNTAQYRFARLLAGPDENLCVVGDDDQSIYAFRGAEVEKILAFRRDFPRAKVIALEENYRSTERILLAANAVIANNPRRHAKSLRATRGPGETIECVELEDEDAEAEEVVARILARRRAGRLLREQAVLMRTALIARPFEEKLRMHGVPYTIIGAGSFFDRKEVRDALAYLRLLAHPADDIAALRILNTPRRGFGAQSRERLDAFARERGISIVEALGRAEEVPALSEPARAGGAALSAALAEARAALEGGGVAAAEVAHVLFERIGFGQALVEMAADANDLEFRRRAVAALFESLARFEERRGRERSLDDFLAGIALDTVSEEKDADAPLPDKVTLLTFHGAKGLEFASVTLAGIDDEMIPHARALGEGGEAALEEERRLFYVALTRARDELLLTRPGTRRRYGKDVPARESRFVAEIPEGLVERRTVTRADEPAADQSAAAGFLTEMRRRLARDAGE
ncbi:MAG: UvrD-helicase domain-containing protein [Planctomycetes bacterium]|nr:UvrD-helicase domain-containing protein [Planctomycetota bacterium]